MRDDLAPFLTFDRMTLRGRRYFFRIRANNGEVLAQSEAYNTARARDQGVAAIVAGITSTGAAGRPLVRAAGF